MRDGGRLQAAIEILSDIGRVALEHAQALREVQAMVERLSVPAQAADEDEDADLLAAAVADRLRRAACGAGVDQTPSDN